MDDIVHACIRDILALAKLDKTPKQVTAELRKRGYGKGTVRDALAYCADTLREGQADG